LAIKRRVIVAVLDNIDCLRQIKGTRRRRRWGGVERRYLQSRCITFAHYAYRYRISESVSVENDVLGITLVDATVLLDKIHW